MLILRWFWRLPILKHAAIFWPDAALTLLGVAVVIWGRRTLQAADTNIDPSRPTTTIVTTGPYRFSRNPLYVALTLIFLGLTLILNTWWGLIVVSPLLFIMHFGVVVREERYLEQKFGDTYRRYRSTARPYL